MFLGWGSWGYGVWGIFQREILLTVRGHFRLILFPLNLSIVFLLTFLCSDTLKLSDTHLCWPWGPFALACPACCSIWDGAPLTVWSRGLCWREITLCLQIKTDCFSFLITSSLSSSHCHAFLCTIPLPGYRSFALCFDAYTQFLFPSYLPLPFTRLCVFLALLINVQLGCVTREEKAQGDFLIDKKKIRLEPF